MDDKELLQKIVAIVNEVPDGLHKYPKPPYWNETEWASLPPMEKGFIYISELIENEDFDLWQIKKMVDINSPDIHVLSLGKGPRFWHNADEEMFFNAIYSMISFVKVEGQGRELFLFYWGVMTAEEKRFLVALLKRYQIKIPKELKGDN